MPIDKELDRILKRGVAEIIIEDELRRLLESGKPLRLKEGFDPSHPDIHLGHVVGLRKLRQLQDLGHKVILIVGDWTARIGDPSGQSQTRPMLTAEEVQANAETYMKQFFKVVDREMTEVKWQSEWFGKFDLADVIRLTSKFTVAQIMAREDFSSRQAAGRPIALTELLYPLLQAYDSVMIEADVELGGTDQKFNLLMGRELQQTVGQRPQQVFMTPLLVGTDGRMKMSKSLGNYITVEDPPNEMFGKLMSVADHLIMDYFELITDVPDEELAGFRQELASGPVNPMTLKKRLAWEIVCQFHGQEAAGEAAGRFEKEVQMKEQPDEIPEHVISFEGLSEAATVSGLIYELKLADSRSEAKRLISQGAIEVDGKRISSDMKIVHGDAMTNGEGNEEELIFRNGSVIRVGKRRWARIFLKEESSNVGMA